jgi:cardiolipin synthase
LRAARRHQAFPPGDEGIRAERAFDVASVLLGSANLRRADLAMRFAPAVSTSVLPMLHGRRYFPRLLADIDAARDHVHVLIYGFKPGTIGARFRDLLVAKARQGLSVRLEVDAIGSEVQFGSRTLFAELRAGGVEIRANQGLPLGRWSRSAGATRRGPFADLLHFDHRKMVVIDGRVGYVGGTGIEDKYADERFYDVMCRVTGPVVAQLQLVFMASWRYQGGTSPTQQELAACFPRDLLEIPGDESAQTSTTVLWNVPGSGHHPISDAIEQSVASASERIDIVNPYITNRAILDLLHAAAMRGIPVRIVVPGKPTPPLPAAAFRHHYARLIDAGVQILLHPEMAHAKVLRIDDRALIGGCNLDDMSLFRNDELDLLFENRAVADLVDAEIFDELVAMSTPAEPSRRRRERVWNAGVNRVSRLL